MEIDANLPLIQTKPSEFKPSAPRQAEAGAITLSKEEAAGAAKSVAAYFASHPAQSLTSAYTLELMVA